MTPPARDLPGLGPQPMAMLFYPLCSLLLGVFLVVAPWTALWDANVLLQPHPLLRSFVLSAFTRGAVSGLGVVNFLLALSEARERLAERR